ncbi:hypothetical protein AVE30378_04923 [Achromobacter veterisilvae]|uniref:Tat pathway signal protein n=1 Tax=Achromobacter veterisilvae TaxID=2069367 RepID=A0A446CW53_9BURK|nr:DUF1513 domain-containing protein [Achromobacter veterisilvae]SSW72083.1 hypothetical protein AVE30378_04923 [Achromobacter veterisilvae]
MAIDRRRFLSLAAALGVAPGAALAAAPEDGAALYLSARKRGGRDEAVLLDEAGRDRLVVPMPARGHSFAIDPAGQRAVVFGRQPGFFGLAFSLDGKGDPEALPLHDERHFFGHGAYVDGGRLLAATENDFEAGRGVLGLYDASPGGAYRRVGEFDTGGIGPHEVVLMPDGKTLCVANGGILTHPDYGKLELNLDTMRPSLAYIDAASGELLEKAEFEPALHRLSIRHLALAADGSVWFGCQYMGPAADRPALVGRHRRGGRLELFEGPAQALRQMRNYVGSVAVDAAGAVVATSSPVGGQVIYWDAASGRCLGTTELADGCGVAPAADQGFLLSSGLGAMLRVDASGAEKQPLLAPSRELSWDNHFRKVAAAA